MKFNFRNTIMATLLSAVAFSTTICVSHPGGVSRPNFPENSTELSRLKDLTKEKTPPKKPILFARNTTSSFKDAVRVDDMMERFFLRLKAFIHRTYFDAVEFEHRLQPLEAELSEIVRDFQNLRLFQKELEGQIVFTTYMFHVMVISSSFMNHFTLQSTYGDYLANTIIELNVITLTLFDRYGLPDPDAKGYVKEVARLGRFLEAWKKTAESLGPFPKPIQSIFQNQVPEAERTLRLLESAI